jgi:hypothetical protein
MMYNVSDFNKLPELPSTKHMVYYVQSILESCTISAYEKQLFIVFYKKLLNKGYAVVYKNRRPYIKYFHFIKCINQRRSFNRIIDFLFTEIQIY